MSIFNYKEGRFTPNPVRMMTGDGAYLSGPIHLYTEKQKNELQAQGVDTSHFTEITAADIEELTWVAETN